jgi:hypothetical protein
MQGMLSNMKYSITTSTDIKDIININQRQVEARDGIRIMELSSLGDIIPFKTAETIRRKLLKQGVKTKQLTNHRSFESWTNVQGFVEMCMDVRYVASETLPIEVEIVMFNDVVAMYQVEPEVSVTVIEYAAFAAQQKALFDNFWKIANKLDLDDDGSTTYGVTIKRTPQEVFDYVSNLANWPEFSDFAANFERVTDTEYIAHTSQGDIRVLAEFDRKRLLLDTTVVLPDGSSDFIPYRVVPNKDGAELIMTNFKPRNASREEYEEQLQWMDIELKRAKELLESSPLAT